MPDHATIRIVVAGLEDFGSRGESVTVAYLAAESAYHRAMLRGDPAVGLLNAKAEGMAEVVALFLDQDVVTVRGKVRAMLNSEDAANLAGARGARAALGAHRPRT